ncbi:unnamed protein product [Meloidogyne enterolobii]|uniref:Uncharacterized protein n=1 Tax=Meloidogyne enterolobii TaxID=390850 RepID=A0ACB1APG5_MELEN
MAGTTRFKKSFKPVSFSVRWHSLTLSNCTYILVYFVWPLGELCLNNFDFSNPPPLTLYSKLSTFIYT